MYHREARKNYLTLAKKQEACFPVSNVLHSKGNNPVDIRYATKGGIECVRPTLSASSPVYDHISDWISATAITVFIIPIVF